MDIVETLASKLALGSLLQELATTCGKYEVVDHWEQGEFHHDLVIDVPSGVPAIPGPVLVVATNCNGGVKEVLCLPERPDRWALWHHRCPDNPEFEGEMPPVLARAITTHWFDPCALLLPDARSELKPEFRERQRGGGWQMKSCRTDLPESNR